MLPSILHCCVSCLWCDPLYDLKMFVRTTLVSRGSTVQGLAYEKRIAGPLESGGVNRMYYDVLCLPIVFPRRISSSIFLPTNNMVWSYLFRGISLAASIAKYGNTFSILSFQPSFKAMFSHKARRSESGYIYFGFNSFWLLYQGTPVKMSV